MLTLQQHAGNAAVTWALRGPSLSTRPVVQRQPGKKQRPAWAVEAEKTLKQMFPKEKLLQGVVIKDYSDFAGNPTHKDSPWSAWTESSTEIYLADPAALGSGAAQKMKLQYILQHEANHVRQFDKAKGPPKTWEAMVDFEVEAYTNDLTWLAGPGATIVSDKKLHKELVDGVTGNLRQLRAIKKNAPKANRKAPKERDEAILDALLAASLVPQDVTSNPLDLYKVP